MEFGVWILDAIERVGLPAVLLGVGAYFFWRLLNIFDRQNTILNAMRVEHDNTDKKIDTANGGIIDLKHEIKQSATTIITRVGDSEKAINAKMDENHKALLGQFNGFVDRITALQGMLSDVKTASESINTGIDGLKADIIKQIQTIKSEDKSNETPKGTIVVNPNFHGVDG